MTSLVNVVSAAAVNRTDNFAYNTETNDGRVETQTVDVYKRQLLVIVVQIGGMMYAYDNTKKEAERALNECFRLAFIETVDLSLIHI